MQDHSANLLETQELVDKLLDQGLSSDEGVRLEALVIEDEACRLHYTRMVRLHAVLPHALARPVEVEARPNLSEQDNQQPSKDKESQLEAATSIQHSSASASAPLLMRSVVERLLRPAPILMTTAALALIAVVGPWVLAPQRPVAQTPLVEEPAQREPAFAARIGAQYRATWAQPTRDKLAGEPEFHAPPPSSLQTNTDLFASDRVFLESGVAEIQFASGARIVLEGPADLVLEGDKQCVLSRGKFAALVKTASARGFVVRTPLRTITDVGTEFGVQVHAEGGLEVAVYQGRVEIRDDATPTVPPSALSEGESLALDSSGKPVAGPADPTRPQFIRVVPTEQSHAPPQEIVHDFKYSLSRNASRLTDIDPAWQGDDLDNWGVSYLHGLRYLRNMNDGDDTIHRRNDARYAFAVPADAKRVTLSFSARTRPGSILEVGLSAGNDMLVRIGQGFERQDRYHIAYRGPDGGPQREFSEPAVLTGGAMRSFRLEIDPTANDGNGTAVLLVEGIQRVAVANLNLKVQGVPRWEALDTLTVRTSNRYVGPGNLAVQVVLPPQKWPEGKAIPESQ